MRAPVPATRLIVRGPGLLLTFGARARRMSDRPPRERRCRPLHPIAKETPWPICLEIRLVRAPLQRHPRRARLLREAVRLEHRADDHAGHRSVPDDPQRRRRHRRLRAGAAGAPTQWMSYLSVSGRRQRVQGGARRRREEPGRADWTTARPAGRRRSPIRPAACSRSGAAPQGDPPEVETTPPGGWIWNELATQDEKTALAFYEKVVRLSPRRDADARRHVLRAEARRQGPRRPVEGDRRIDADDVDCRTSASTTPTRQADQAKSLGATVVVPPIDIPGVGRFAVFGDPQGAALAILKPNPEMA